MWRYYKCLCINFRVRSCFLFGLLCLPCLYGIVRLCIVVFFPPVQTSEMNNICYFLRRLHSAWCRESVCVCLLLPGFHMKCAYYRSQYTWNAKWKICIVLAAARKPHRFWAHATCAATRFESFFRRYKQHWWFCLFVDVSSCNKLCDYSCLWHDKYAWKSETREIGG